MIPTFITLHNIQSTPIDVNIHYIESLATTEIHGTPCTKVYLAGGNTENFYAVKETLPDIRAMIDNERELIRRLSNA